MTYEKEIFRRGSTSFYVSSLLFRKDVRKDVFDLYSFLRVADDYVDEIPKKPKQLDKIIKLWEEAKSNPESPLRKTKADSLNSRVAKNIVRLQRKHNFAPEWIDNFLATMKSDLNFKPKKTLSDSLRYCEGSAEVVGLMMSRIMGLPESLDNEAKLLGRAFQWVNFIRDVEEDNRLGRCYFPKNDLDKFGLKDLSFEAVMQNPLQFEKFINFQAARYESWCGEAKTAFPHIPKQQRLPLLVATELFDWTINQIKNDPLVVYRQKVRPSKTQITFFVFKQSLKRIL